MNKLVDINNLLELIDNVQGEIVIADENIDIVYMNKEAINRYDKYGGKSLIGKSLLDCHNPKSQDEIRRMYKRFANGDLRPWQYRIPEEGYVDLVTVTPILSNGQVKGCMEMVVKMFETGENTNAEDCGERGTTSVRKSET